ncbi:DUF6492 family protein [Methylobacterium marchantiae]|uniref:DUF6492 family protein n=1 Tax=Methylobacterium marchantiae TaxID=600331 RepID=A0ABW3WWY6_9HYPH|nr:hypothetical protein AIGOOFII_3409 [Methylobacterium marchantiae]
MKAETGHSPSAPAGQSLAETVGLITLSHRGDLERCALLFETIDRHATPRGCHYVIVDDKDVALFARFERPDRRILPLSHFLPWWMRPIPVLRWRGRRYWFTPFGKPISGWHIQQIVKIEATRRLPEARYCLIDSDIYFFRDFDLTALAEPNPTPFHVHPGGVVVNRPRHILWIDTASRLLGTEPPSVPADDYIDQIIIWDQATARAMTDRIESVTRHGWIGALCRDRNFSEYMIYGTFVASTPSAMDRHAVTTRSFCRTHWEDNALREADILAMLHAATPTERAFCIQSFGATPLATIRTSLEAFHSGCGLENPKSRTQAA